MTVFAEIRITCDFFSFKDNPFSILKSVRLATHAEYRRLPYLLANCCSKPLPPPLPSFSSSRLLFLLALLKKCLSHNGMLAFVESSSWTLVKLTGSCLGMKTGQIPIHRKAGGKWTVCSLMEWRCDLWWSRGVIFCIVEVCSLVEWRCDPWWSGGVISYIMEV